MAGRGDWLTVKRSSRDGADRLFFNEHEWATIEAASERIYPGDGGPGARAAQVTRFIDRYLSGLDFVFASAGGDGFQDIAGKDANAWRTRIEGLQRTYREGVRNLDAVGRAEFGGEFRLLGEDEQERVLEIVSGAPKPTGVRTGETGEAHVQNISDDALTFFDALTLHTRQGMFCDPIYGGNHDRVGWAVVGFPGPSTLEETRNCSYGHPDKFLRDFDWADLIPHLRTGVRPDANSESPPAK